VSRVSVDLNTAQGPKDAPVDRPRVVDTSTGRVLLDLWDTWDWDARVVSNERATVTLALRRHPGTANAVLTIDAEAGTYRLAAVRGRWQMRELRSRLRKAGLSRG
jgi:hypothetical protein